MEPPAPMAHELPDSLPDREVGVVRTRAVACERDRTGHSLKRYSSKPERDMKCHSNKEGIQASSVVLSERRNEAASLSSSIIKHQDEKSFSEWDAIKSDTRGRPIVVKATVRSTPVPSPKMPSTPKGTLPSALRTPTFIARANARIKSEDTCITHPESRNGDSDDDDDEDYSKELALVTPEQVSPSFLEAKSSPRVNGVSFGSVEVREHSFNEGLSVIDTVEGYEAKRRDAKQLPRVPKDAPTKKSLTYETIRVQGVTKTPRSTQVAHHEPQSLQSPPSQDFLYSDFEAKFQSRENKRGGKMKLFFGFFKRKSSKKNSSLVHI